MWRGECRGRKKREARRGEELYVSYCHQTRASGGKESKTDERGGEWGTVTHISC